jgi:hypothetical protein
MPIVTNIRDLQGCIALCQCRRGLIVRDGTGARMARKQRAGAAGDNKNRHYPASVCRLVQGMTCIHCGLISKRPVVIFPGTHPVGDLLTAS